MKSVQSIDRAPKHTWVGALVSLQWSICQKLLKFSTCFKRWHSVQKMVPPISEKEEPEQQNDSFELKKLLFSLQGWWFSTNEQLARCLACSERFWENEVLTWLATSRLHEGDLARQTLDVLLLQTVRVEFWGKSAARVQNASQPGKLRSKSPKVSSFFFF